MLMTGLRRSPKVVRIKSAGRKKRRLKIGPVGTLIVIAAVALLAWSLLPLGQRLEREEEVRELEQKVAALREENQALREEIAHLKSDEYVEKLAREELGLVKEGESAYLVVPPKGEERTDESKPQKRERTLWQKFEAFLKNLFD
jgi:cell division protein DivIC